jgi:methyl-accepting chemotaxis protein
MNPIKNMKLSLRVILSFGAAGLVLILLTTFFSQRLDQSSSDLRDEVAQYESLNQTYRGLYSLSFEIQSTINDELAQRGSVSGYQSLAAKFNQDISSLRSQTDPAQATTIEEIADLWRKTQLTRNEAKSALGRNREQAADSLKSQFSSIQSKLASAIDLRENDFFQKHLEKIQSIASVKNEIWYTAYSLLVVLVVIGFFWYRALTLPLQALMKATKKIANGEWGTRVEFNSKNEYGNLGESFNKMSGVTARLVACLNEVGNPVYSIDRQFTLQFANEAALRFAGSRKEEVILKKKCYEVFNLPLCRTPDCPVSLAWKGQSMVSGETFASPQHIQVPVLYHAAAVSEMDGQILRGVEVLTDITQMKKVTAEIEAERKYLSESINLLLEKMTEFANGNLTIDINSESADDIGKLYSGFNKSIRNIKATMEQLVDAVESTASASAEISSSIEEIAVGVSQQSSQANDVAASVEQMTKTVTDNARNAAKVEQAARENGAVAQSGGEIVQKTVLKMKEIAEVVKKSADTVNQLGELSKQISEIVSVIDEIADQTNLLALNAAIEAARAGEEGRGFAVVADEVRKLAERTTQATKQISTMIKNVQASTGEAVNAMRNGIQEVTKGLVLADEAGSSLKNIVSNAHGIVDMISQIAAANEEQSTTSNEISRNVELISTVSSQSATGISQIAGAADDLNRLTTNLQTLISKFKLVGNKDLDRANSSILQKTTTNDPPGHSDNGRHSNTESKSVSAHTKSAPASGNDKLSEGRP